MAAILPIVNNDDGNLIETLQTQVDESIVRENEMLETLESHKSFLEEISGSVLSLLNPLNQIVELMVDDKRHRERMEDLEEQKRVKEDIEGERPGPVDVSDPVVNRDPLFDFSNIDTGIISNILGAAVLAYIYGVDDILRGAAAAFTLQIQRAVRLVFEAPLKIFRSISTFIKSLDILGPIQRVISGPIKLLTGTFNMLGRILAPAAQSLAAAGRILRPILGPFTLVLFGIVDFVKGFIGGFREGGLLEGLKGGLRELLSGLVGIPLDMMKSLVSWVSEKFGWEGVSEALKEFSFVDLIRDAFDRVWNFFSEMFTLKNLKSMIFGGDEDREEQKERAEGLRIDDPRINAMKTTEVIRDSEEAVRNRTKNDQERLTPDRGMTDTGRTVSRTSTERAQSRERSAQGSSSAIISAPVTDNSRVSVQNNRTQFQSKPSPRSSEHGYRRLQNSYVGGP